MGKKAPFWIFVEELADKMRKGAHPLSFPEIKQMADMEWPTLSDEARDRYKMLARQDRGALPVIRYEPPPPEAQAQRNTAEVPDYAHVLSKFFTLVDTASDTTVGTGGEIALAGFSLRDGVSEFLSAHLLPLAASETNPVRRLLQLPIVQKSSIIVSSASDVLAEISQFCDCEQVSAGKIVLFASREKVEILRNLFRNMLDNGVGVSVIIEPIEKLIGVIHVALAHQTEQVDLGEVARISAQILRRSSAHARVPCSRHRPTDIACAHGGVSALAFSFINAFIDDLKQLGVDTKRGTHCLQPKSTPKVPNGTPGKNPPQIKSTPKVPNGTPGKTPPKKNESSHADPMAVVPGPVVFVPGKGRLRTVAKMVPWNGRNGSGGNGESQTPAQRL